MRIWVFIILIFALVGLVLNIVKGAPMELLLAKDIILLLITLGMLIRIEYKTKQGEREKSGKK
jgi:hypothetical protein